MNINDIVLIPLRSGQGCYLKIPTNRAEALEGLNPFEIRARLLPRRARKVWLKGQS